MIGDSDEAITTGQHNSAARAQFLHIAGARFVCLTLVPAALRSAVISARHDLAHYWSLV
jgi:hypothetical protein